MVLTQGEHDPERRPVLAPAEWGSGSFAERHFRQTGRRNGSEADISDRPSDVRYYRESGHSLRQWECPLWANSKLVRRSKSRCYSITSSAVASSDAGIVNPRTLAVLRLTMSANFVGSWIGRSAGFSRYCSAKSGLQANELANAMIGPW